MLCKIKPVPFHESDKHIFDKIPGGGGGPDPRSSPLDLPMSLGKWNLNLKAFGKKSVVQMTRIVT